MSIQILGASEHNLKQVDVEFGDGLTVVTGVSGSGKTSLVFDTLYHEAERRLAALFTLGTARAGLTPAHVQAITGLGPMVAVDQNRLNRNPNSTLATASGLHPLLRLLYANFGARHCPTCHAPIEILSEDDLIDRLVHLSRQSAITLSLPLVRQARGSHRTLLAFLQAQFDPATLRVDGQPGRPNSLAPDQAHDIELVLAQWHTPQTAAAVRDVVSLAAALGGQSLVARHDDKQSTLAQAPVCVHCGAWLERPTPLHFHTACPYCEGQGCERCARTGLHPTAATVRWQGQRWPDLLAASVTEVRRVFGATAWPASAVRLRTELDRRLEALDQVGLGYLSLDRPSPTLSRGEAQRVRLAVALTSRLEDMIHVLDEPTVGLHPADVARLLPVLRQLGGPVIYVEHERAAVAYADRVIDLGPGAGPEGGQICFEGSPGALWQAETLSGQYFSRRLRVPLPPPRPTPTRFLAIEGADRHNLKQLNVEIPLERLAVITGVSGSGKSTLVEAVLVASLNEGKPVGCRSFAGPTLKPIWVDQNPIGQNPRSNPATYTDLATIIRDLFAARTGLSASHFSFNRPEGACPDCEGMGAIQVKLRYLASSWIPCVTCEGRRFSEMVLAAKVTFRDHTLSIADFYQLTVAQVRPYLLDQADLPAKVYGQVRRILDALHEVGLDYLPLGQPSPTLSGGEAQRLKLAKYLGKRSLKGQLLILDEPSTGLHPHNVADLLQVLYRLVSQRATVIVVEHNTDLIRAADWVIDLGPGAGPAGGHLLYAGPPAGLSQAEGSATGRALQEEESLQPSLATDLVLPSPPPVICIRGAEAHNLKAVDVDIPKGALTVVTGVSGSGKSSLVGDVLEAEARRRFLETLSLYERQSTREGPEAPVRSITGLGAAVSIGPERRLRDRRATVGTATEIAHHLAVLLAWLGERRCPTCESPLVRSAEWHCPNCGFTAPLPAPRHFNPNIYAAACQTCQGVGTLRKPNPDKLIIAPDKPLCQGAMYSPGFFPKGFLCQPFNSGYDLLQALAARYAFDPATTPWQTMSAEARQAFLFGDPQPLTVTYHSRTGRSRTRSDAFPGFFGWVRDWDVGGTYTDTQLCPDCQGARLRADYRAVTLAGYDYATLSRLPLGQLGSGLASFTLPQGRHHLVETSLNVIRRRLAFLQKVGLGYLHLSRAAATLSAGEAQRIKLAGLLGSDLTSLTVLLDEPSRGLHPAEVEALIQVLGVLRDEGNTVIVVEHEPAIMAAADWLIDMGPGAGAAGGTIVAQGSLETVKQTGSLTARWLRGERRLELSQPRREPRGWLTITGTRANNLQGETVALPLGCLVGVCGVSGSGKSTLLMDTLGRVVAPKKQTTSVAYETIEPGEYESITGAPARAIVIDQSRAGVTNPANFLGLISALETIFAEDEEAQALGLTRTQLYRRCSVCRGQGFIRLEMGFLPDVGSICETCQGSGYGPEAWQVRRRGLTLPEVLTLTVDQVYEAFPAVDQVGRPLTLLREVGLGYLVLRQPGYSLSGGEAQRLKIAKELSRKTPSETLFLLDEPTVGQHPEDVARLSGVLHRLVDDGHSVIVIEHHPHLLAACDWLIELGPGGGPDGGRVIASAPPERVANGDTPLAPYLKMILEVKR